MHSQRKEGLPIHGELYHKQAMIHIRLEEFGAKRIQEEIKELWIEIMLRTDILSECELPIKKGGNKK